MLGVAYLFENRPDEARREFKKLLALNPEFRFDPLLDSQRGVDVLRLRSSRRNGSDKSGT